MIYFGNATDNHIMVAGDKSHASKIKILCLNIGKLPWIFASFLLAMPAAQ